MTLEEGHQLQSFFVAFRISYHFLSGIKLKETIPESQAQDLVTSVYIKDLPVDILPGRLKQYFVKCEASNILNVCLSILVCSKSEPYINMSVHITFYKKITEIHLSKTKFFVDKFNPTNDPLYYRNLERKFW